MTDHDRAERALARAFAEHAADVDFAPLDPEQLRAKTKSPTEGFGGSNASPRRTGRPWGGLRPWAQVAIAAALLPLVAVPVVGLVSSMFNAQSSAPAGAPAAAPAPPGFGTSAGGVPEVDGGQTHVTADRASSDGWRWESMLDVSVQVPDDWGYGFAPAEDWCAADGHQRPEHPFVQRNPLSQATRSILCTEPMPDSLRQTHLTWRHAQPADADGTVALDPAGQWVQVNRVVGAAFLTVEVPATDVELAQRILAMARTNEVDPRGCPTSSPDQAPTAGISALTTTSDLTVCQYTGQVRPNLAGSYAMAGDQAQAVLDAVHETAAWTGPATPTCGDAGDWLVLRFDGGAHQVRINTAPCAHATLDDGVTPRTASRATCGDLVTGPLWLADMSAEAVACTPIGD